MLDCKHASQLLSQSQERRLSLAEWVDLKFHLFLCDACRNFSRQLGLLREALRSLVRQFEGNESVRLSDEARVRIAKILDQCQ